MKIHQNLQKAKETPPHLSLLPLEEKLLIVSLFSRANLSISMTIPLPRRFVPSIRPIHASLQGLTVRSSLIALQFLVLRRNCVGFLAIPLFSLAYRHG